MVLGSDISRGLLKDDANDDDNDETRAGGWRYKSVFEPHLRQSNYVRIVGNKKNVVRKDGIDHLHNRQSQSRSDVSIENSIGHLILTTPPASDFSQPWQWSFIFCFSISIGNISELDKQKKRMNKRIQISH